MYNQTEAILSQYEIEIHAVGKGRGAFICDTNKGKKLLMPYRGSKEKGMQFCGFLEELERRNFQAEKIELTKAKEAVAEDEYTGERFLLKSYIEGNEINTSSLKEMKEAVHALAKYHNTTQEMCLLDGVESHTTQTMESLKKHANELSKVRNYIRNGKKKNEFEQIYMKNFEHNKDAAKHSIFILEELEKDLGENSNTLVFCHGDFNQHNVLVRDGEYQMIHFENYNYNWAAIDLANFMRKMLEKNDWNETIGFELIQEYDKWRSMTLNERKQLYGLLLFPEKFWKVANHYMNTRKTWISEKEIDKLKKVISQEEKRLGFMTKMSNLLD